MSAPFREINVRLQRDAFNTPWGFRLQGGRDFKGPLTVQRVFVGSPAEGELQRGDVIVSIEGNNTGFMVHKQAQDIIKAAGGTLQMFIKRGLQQQFGVSGSTSQSTQPASNQPFRSRGFDGTAPKPDPKLGAFSPTKSPGISTDLGVVYGAGRSRAPGGNMLNRLNQSLNQAIYDDDVDYSQRSIHDLRNAFSGPTHLAAQYTPPDHAEPYSTLSVTVKPQPVTVEDDYVRKPVKELKRQFANKQKNRRRRPVSYHGETHPDGEDRTDPTRSSRPQKWNKPASGYSSSVPAGLVEPGWTPHKQTEMGWTPHKQTEMGWTPPKQHIKTYVPQESYLERQSRPAPPPVNRPQQHHGHPSHGGVHHVEPGPPAWAGSLRGAGGPKPWEVHAAAAAIDAENAAQPQATSPRQPPQNAAQGSAFTPHQPRVQNVHYGPGQSGPQYSQRDTGGADHTDTARVAHLQYNTPLGLYSRDNAQDVLRSQTGGAPGDGTMVITGGGGGKSLDLSKSETYRLIHEQERGGPRSARYIEHNPGQEMHYQGYQDQKKQSPSMHALQHFVGAEAPVNSQGQQAVSHSQGQQAAAPAAPAAPAPAADENEGPGYSDF